MTRLQSAIYICVFLGRVEWILHSFPECGVPTVGCRPPDADASALARAPPADADASALACAPPADADASALACAPPACGAGFTARTESSSSGQFLMHTCVSLQHGLSEVNS